MASPDVERSNYCAPKPSLAVSWPTAWLADPEAVARYEISARRGSGRTLDASTAWGLLWELSGLDADWLSDSTRARVRRRIRNSDATSIAAAVASRTRAHRYTSANTERAAAGLIRTGRSAASLLGTDLIEDTRNVAGYVRSGSVDDYASAHFLVEHVNGKDVLYENTLPISYGADAMPPAVIAADLSASTDTRERSAASHNRRSEVAMAGGTLNTSGAISCTQVPESISPVSKSMLA